MRDLITTEESEAMRAAFLAIEIEQEHRIAELRGEEVLNRERRRKRRPATGESDEPKATDQGALLRSDVNREVCEQ